MAKIRIKKKEDHKGRLIAYLRLWRYGCPAENKSIFQSEVDLVVAFDEYCKAEGVSNGLEEAKAIQYKMVPSDKKVSRVIPKAAPPKKKRTFKVRIAK